MSGYEVQGRRRTGGGERRHAREEVRLTATDDRDAALRAANSMVADGFTAWVFSVDQKLPIRTYSLVKKLPPSNTH